jgi:hypothetical protein
VVVKKETSHEDKTNPMDRTNHNLLAAGGNYRRFFVLESEHISTPAINALSAGLGECIFPL